MSKSVDLWLDLKSPYSFLAKDPAYALEKELGVTLRLRPYALDILGAYNVADPKVAERGLRRIKYLYLDVRRFANQRGMIIRGPQKIFDSTLIHLAWMFADARRQGQGADRRRLSALLQARARLRGSRRRRSAADGDRRRLRGLRRLRDGRRSRPCSPGTRRRPTSRACSPCRPSSSTASCSGARTGSTSCAPSSAPSCAG